MFEVIKGILNSEGWADMSTLNPEEKYKLPTFGKNPKKTKNGYVAEKYIRVEVWNNPMFNYSEK